VLFKRGFRNCFIQGIHRINPDAPPMVGPAYTLRYIPAREDLDHLGVFEDRSHPQRKGVEECPPGAVFVIDSRKNFSAASAAASCSRVSGSAAAPGSSRTGASRHAGRSRICPFRPITPPGRADDLIRHHAVDLNLPSPAVTWRSIRAT
jgi:regulator of RNase E activity RraA